MSVKNFFKRRGKVVKLLLFRAADRMEDSVFLQSICRGIVFIIPFIILNSFCSFLITLPIPAYQDFLQNGAGYSFFTLLETVHKTCSGYLGIIAAGSIGWNFAKRWRLSPHQLIFLPLLSIVCFLLLIDCRVEYLSTKGMPSSILASVLACGLYFKLLKAFPVPKLLKTFSAKPYIHAIMISMLPMVCVVMLTSILQQFILYAGNDHVFQESLVKFMEAVLRPWESFALLMGILHSLVCQIWWFFGIQGENIMSAIRYEYYFQSMSSNLAALQMGRIPENIFNVGFHETFLLMGGCGCMLSLIAAILLVGKMKITRTLAKIALFPSFINISEVMVFGLPIVCNPIYLFPFLVVPLVNLVIAYEATQLGIIPIITHIIPWTIPIFINGYLSAGTLAVTFMQAFLFIIDVIIYVPFVRLDEEHKKRHFVEHVRQLENICRQLEDVHLPMQREKLDENMKYTVTMLLEELNAAIEERKGIYLLYQPQVDLTGEVMGAEALLRWQHPLAGFIYPPLIIVLSKMGGILPKLEKLIFADACRSVAELEKILGKDRKFKISINITGESLRYDGMSEALVEAVEKAKISKDKLWIELTEQDAVTLDLRTIDRLKKLRERGHKLAIDDFGMGHTSIKYLQVGIFDVVKLDGSITKQVLKNGSSNQIVSSLADLSHKMHMTTVAEYVDNIPQRDELEKLGCEIFQGYLYSKPVPLNELVALMQKETETEAEK